MIRELTALGHDTLQPKHPALRLTVRRFRVYTASPPGRKSITRAEHLPQTLLSNLQHQPEI
jgi:hypothetical protein